MTNKQIIESAKNAMNELYNTSGGKLLEHDQVAYNCLRLMCERLEKIEAMRPLIEEMRSDALDHISSGQDPDANSWGYQEGVLIQNKHALDVYEACFG